MPESLRSHADRGVRPSSGAAMSEKSGAWLSSQILNPMELAAPEDPPPLSGSSGGQAGRSPRNTFPALSVPAALEKVGVGALCVLSEEAGQKTHGRALTVADRLHDERVIIAKWIRRLIKAGYGFGLSPSM